MQGDLFFFFLPSFPHVRFIHRYFFVVALSIPFVTFVASFIFSPARFSTPALARRMQG